MLKGFKIVALICCRGGSKGIPNKNIKEFCGKPLLGWILDAAKKANVFDDIILSTDSDKIAKVGQSYGINVPGLRPDTLANDDSDVFDTHDYIFEKMNIKDETHRTCILTNNPFINHELIQEGYQMACSVNFENIVLDTVPVGGDYIFYRQCSMNNGLLNFIFSKEMKESGINRQKITPKFTTINNMRWGKPSFMTNYEHYKNEIVNNGILPFTLPKTNNFDLDDIEDWKIAEAVFEKLFL